MRPPSSRPTRSSLLTVILVSQILLSILVLRSGPVKAQVSEVHWDTDRFISTDIAIAADETLIVGPGVNVYLDPGINITVNGNITVRGTPASPVTFEWNSTGDRWGTINIWDSREASHLENCIIEHGTRGIYAYNSDVVIRSSEITDSLKDGIHITNGDILLEDTTFETNGQAATTEGAIYLNGATGSLVNNTLASNNNGIFVKEASSVEIRNNDIHNGTFGQSFGILVRSGSTPLIDGNLIRHNFAGIMLNSSSSRVSNNTIEGNLDDGVLIIDNDNSTVKDNIITDNGDEGVDVNSGSTPSLAGNQISGNQEKGILAWNASPLLEGNDIHHNNIGVRITAASEVNSTGNTVHENDLHGLLVDAGSRLTSASGEIYGNGDAGLFIEASSVNVGETSMEDNPRQLVAVDGADGQLENVTMTGASNDTIFVNGSNLVLLNVTRDPGHINWSGPTSNLTFMWYMGIRVLDGHGAPFPGANVSLVPSNHQPSQDHVTDGHGEVNWIPLIQEIGLYSDMGVAKTAWSPYTVNVSYMGHANETIVHLDNSTNVTMVLDVPNEPPALDLPIPDLNMSEDTTAHSVVDLSDHFSDPEGGNLSYQVDFEEEEDKVDCVINGTALDFHTPTGDWYGTRHFRIRATDPLGALALSNNFSMEVLPVNDPPALAPIEPQSVQVNATLRFGLNGSDVDDGDALVYRTPDSFIPEITVSLDASSGVVSFRSMISGEFEIRFEVCDPLGLCSGYETAHITVYGDNKSPQFYSEPVRTAHIETEYRYEVEAVDPDGDDLTLFLDRGPDGMEIDGWNLSWVPDSSQMTQHAVSLALTDGINPTVYQNFTITVMRMNRPPDAEIVRPGHGDEVDAGEAILFSARAQDPDGDTLSYLWRINGNVVGTGKDISRTLSPGTNAVSLAVSDGTVTVYHNITVTATGSAGPAGPTDPHPTDVEGEEWCLWLPLTLVTVSVVIVFSYELLVQRSRPPRRDGP